MDLKMNYKTVGLVFVLIGIVLTVFAILNNYLNSLVIPYLSPQICSQHCNTLSLENYVIYALIVASFILGIYFIIFYKQNKEEQKKEEQNKVKIEQKEVKPAVNLSSLTPDERRIIEVVTEGGGVLFQSDIVEKTGFPKAKVSRILDRLEAREVVERRRRGMTNAIMIKK